MQSQNAIVQEYSEAERVFHEGKLQEAVERCQAILMKDPHFAHGYYLMSALFRSVGNFGKALHYNQIAIDMAPQNPVFYLHKGQICFAARQSEEAVAALEHALKLDGQNVLTLILLADSLADLGRFADAKRYFTRARKISPLPEVDEHMGLCLVIEGDLDGAMKLFSDFIRKWPQDARGYQHLGKLQFNRGKKEEARQLFEKAIALHPANFESLQGLAVMCMEQHDEESAVQYAQRALAIKQDLLPAYYLIGNIMMEKFRYADAEKVYKAALSIHPLDLYATHGLANALLSQHRGNEALTYIDQVLAQQPDNQSMRYFSAMLRGEQFDAAPKEYVSSLFDAYADQFEHHLQKVLQYNTPDVLAEEMRHILGERAAAGKLTMLDLGCGTGLAAVAMHDMASDIVGVDLSAKMLEKARAKNLYSSLHAQDLTEYMQNCGRQFDLVVAADVLIYMGELAPCLSAARSVMKQDGLLVFTLEKASEGTKDYKLYPSGRYKHQPDYVRQSLDANGYHIRLLNEVVIRTENKQPVHGMLIIADKARTN